MSLVENPWPRTFAVDHPARRAIMVCPTQFPALYEIAINSFPAIPLPLTPHLDAEIGALRMAFKNPNQDPFFGYVDDDRYKAIKWCDEIDTKHEQSEYPRPGGADVAVKEKQVQADLNAHAIIKALVEPEVQLALRNVLKDAMIAAAKEMAVEVEE